MAKIVEVTYGLHNINTKKTYKYMVNDNVKRGSVIMPVVNHYKTHKDFTTMAVVQKSMGGKNGMTNGEFQSLMQEIEDGATRNQNPKMIGNITFAEQPSKAVLQAMRQKNNKNQYQYTGEKGFSDKTDNFEDGMVRVGDETYQNNKQSQAIQDERERMSKNVIRENAQTANGYESYQDMWNRTMKGIKH